MTTFNDIDTFAELKAAITQASGNTETDIINITGDITVSDNLPLIDESMGLTINGSNHALSGNNERRILFVKSGNITFDRLNFTQGKALGINGGCGGGGGAIFIRSGSLNLSSVNFDGNTATGGTGTEKGKGLGGAIFAMKNTITPNGNNQGMPTILPTVTGSNSTFLGNAAADAANPTQDGNGVNLNTSAVFGSINTAPTVANAIADKVTTAGSPLSFTLPTNTFADVDAGDTLTLSAAIANGSPLPTWLTFDAATGKFSANPTAGDVGAIVSLGATVTMCSKAMRVTIALAVARAEIYCSEAMVTMAFQAVQAVIS